MVASISVFCVYVPLSDLSKIFHLFIQKIRILYYLDNLACATSLKLSSHQVHVPQQLSSFQQVCVCYTRAGKVWGSYFFCFCRSVQSHCFWEVFLHLLTPCHARCYNEHSPCQKNEKQEAATGAVLCPWWFLVRVTTSGLTSSSFLVIMSELSY